VREKHCSVVGKVWLILADKFKRTATCLRNMLLVFVDLTLLSLRTSPSVIFAVLRPNNSRGEYNRAD